MLNVYVTITCVSKITSHYADTVRKYSLKIIPTGQAAALDKQVRRDLCELRRQQKIHRGQCASDVRWKIVPQSDCGFAVQQIRNKLKH